MTYLNSKMARRLAIVLAALTAPTLNLDRSFPLEYDRAFSQNADASEKAAFEAAKALGTVEAWDAFLTHYPNGFRADLARAYVKKLAEQPSVNSGAGTNFPPPSAPTPPADYPVIAGTWGGIVRTSPGQGNARVASLDEGETVTLMAPPIPVAGDDFPWFKIAFRNGGIGYMWGGILCSRDFERPGLFKICTSKGSTSRVDAPQVRPELGAGRPSWCASPSNGAEAAICRDPDLLSLDRAMNVAYGRAKSDSPGEVAGINTEQRKWLGRRNLCGDDASCVRKRYDEQIQLLESYFAN